MWGECGVWAWVVLFLDTSLERSGSGARFQVVESVSEICWVPRRAQHINEDTVNLKGFSTNQPFADAGAKEAVECRFETWR